MEDFSKPDMTGQTRSGQPAADASIPSTSAPSGRIKLTRGPEEVSTGQSLSWATAALEEFDKSQARTVRALRKQAEVFAKARGASTVTEVEVRDALRRIVIGLPKSVWVRAGRIVAVLAVFGGGAGLSFGLAEKDPVICILSFAIGLTLVVLEEMLLEFRKQP